MTTPIIEKMEDDLSNQNAISCFNCQGTMEFDYRTDTWVCNDCRREMNADDLMENIIAEQGEMHFD